MASKQYNRYVMLADRVQELHCITAREHYNPSTPVGKGYLKKSRLGFFGNKRSA